jgi:5-methylthioadenosine/S-adenosylhomocysteine deaminase
MGLSAIMPGLVDCHTHLEYSVFRGICDDLPFGLWKVQQQEKSALLTEEDWQVSANLGAQEALRGGITTIADVTDTGASLRAAMSSGLRGKVFYEISGLKYDQKNLDKAISEMESWQTEVKGSLIDIGISPHAVYTTAPALLKEVSAIAVDKKLLNCIHVSGSMDEYHFVKYGSGPLAHRFKDLSGFKEVLWQPMGTSVVKYLEQWDVFNAQTVAIHCIHVDEQDLDVLARNKVSVVHCPSCAAKLGMGIAPLKKLSQRKLKLGLGTDSPASNNTMDIFEEMRLGLLLQRAYNQSTADFSAADFLTMATLGGAKVLGLGKQIGSLEVGKKADMVVVDLSQSYQLPAPDPYSAIVYTCSSADVLLTMVDGEVRFKREEGEALDDKLYKQINDLRIKLAKK